MPFGIYIFIYIKKEANRKRQDGGFFKGRRHCKKEKKRKKKSKKEPKPTRYLNKELPEYKPIQNLKKH